MRTSLSSFHAYGGGAHRYSLWSEHKTKSPCEWRRLRRNRNPNSDIWESPRLYPGEDVKEITLHQPNGCPSLYKQL
ncbi:hypothetical protein [Calothrix rhizosoleniae]|uniref:hypothetical protein n=1 Tax=Calothrix rhizosoleniae TaxID=888997 RepID=UPI0011778D96|nr:hypothetical protein [Calothrix rhizosoleniae]